MFNSKIAICLLLSMSLNQPRVAGADETTDVEKDAIPIAGEVGPAKSSVQPELAGDATFNQTHTFIRSLILNQKVVYERPLAAELSEKFRHWHDVSYSVTSYSADKCKIVYGRLLSRPAVHGHAALSSRKGVSFDVKQVEEISLRAWSDFDPKVGRSSSLPSGMILFYGPATVMSNGKGSKRPSHGITVDSATADLTLKAFQHLKMLCTS